MTIRSYLQKFAEKTPQNVALKCFQGKNWHTCTYADFLSDVRRTAEAYGTTFSLKPREENVALILPNSPTWMEVYLACSGAGVSVVPIDPKLHNDEVAYILGDSGAAVVTTDRSHLDMMRAIVPNLPSVRAVVLVDGEGAYEAIGSVPVHALAALCADVRDTSWYDAHVATADDVASIIYTSGTTGKPKGRPAPASMSAPLSRPKLSSSCVARRLLSGSGMVRASASFALFGFAMNSSTSR